VSRLIGWFEWKCWRLSEWTFFAILEAERFMQKITMQDIIHWLFLVVASAFFGAPLMMISVRWWQQMFNMAVMPGRWF
jgi:hypothetical protein